MHDADAWQRVLDFIQPKVNVRSFQTWLRPTRLDASPSGNGRLVVRVPTWEFADWIGEHCSSLIVDALTALGLAQEVSYVCESASIASHAPSTASDAREEGLARLECFSAIRPKPLRWVWPQRIPAGKLSLVVGDPDKGKSLIAIDIAARITTGQPFPDGAVSVRGSVILLSAEDDPEDTIRPRLDAASADISRVYLLQAVRVVLRDGTQAERGFSLEADMGALDDAIRRTRDVRLVVIDPISAYLGAADAHKNAEIRGLLAPLKDLTARTGVSVLAVTHLRKSGGLAIHRSIDSIAFAAAARAVWAIAEDADQPDRRVMARVKGNLSGDPGALAYRIDAPSGTPRIIWETSRLNLRADDLLGDPDEKSAIGEACELLGELLREAPTTAKEVYRQAREAGISPATLRRAKKRLRVRSAKEHDEWKWHLDAQHISK